MTFNLGTISTIVTHLYAVMDIHTRRPLATLCGALGTMPPMQAGELHTTTEEAANVTCPECIEWMHA